jgi:hypothetical protein
MVNRTTVSGSSTPPLAPVDFFVEYAERFDTVFDASALPLTSIGGTGDAVTATLDPPLATAGVFVDGMKFTLTWGAANTGGVTLAINGGAALAVVDAAGDALVADNLAAGLRSMIEYVGGSFRVLTALLDGAAQSSYYWAFTASGTWTKPSGLDDDRMVFVEAWGAGAGGGSGSPGGGGGGGGYLAAWFRAADLPSTVAITIGAGGAVNANGSNSSFGALVTAWGGVTASAGNGGRGGGAGAGGLFGAGTAGPTSGDKSGGPALTENGGGGGGGSATSSAGGDGGAALRGGGGGGGVNVGGFAAGAGGVSIYGGNGGASGSAGTAPGGGGGRNAAGARGEVRVWI